MSRVVTNNREPNFRDSDGNLYLVRCFNCDRKHGRENYGPMVHRGRCAWCGWEETYKFGGSSGLAYEPGASAHETPDAAQRQATTDTGGRESDGLEPADADTATPMHRESPAADISYSDPGDGYDSAIRWHADFERGDL